MSQLELLWQLENHSNLLEEHKKHLYIIENNLELTNLEVKHKKYDDQITYLKSKVEDINKDVRDKENILKNNAFSIQELDKQLYDGSVTELNQLNYLLLEKENLTNQVGQMETEMISSIESVESIKSDLVRFDGTCKRTVKEIKNYKKKNETILKDIQNKIDTEEKEIQKYTKDLDPKLLTKFNGLRKNRGKAVVTVAKDVCSGCNMFIPSYLHEKIRNMDEIITCEQCGRILYYKLP